MVQTVKIPLRERKHAQTKLALLDALKKNLESRPFEDITIEDICQTVPLSKVTFYNYFKNKEDLLFFFMQLLNVRITWHIKNKQDLKEGKETLKELMCEADKFFTENTIIMRPISKLFSKLEVCPHPIKLERAEKMLAYPDLKGIEDTSCTHFPQHINDHINKAIHCGELPKKTDPKIAASVMTSVFSTLHKKLNPTQINKIAPAEDYFEIIWIGLNGYYQKDHPKTD